MIIVSNFKEQMLSGKIYKNLPERKIKLDFAIAGCNIMLNNTDKTYVSISFGKQSLCVAHMMFQLKPDIPMFFLASDETWEMYDYKKVIDDFTKKYPINLSIVQTNRFYNSFTWKQSRDSGDKDLQQMCNRDEWDGWFWGLAKDESKIRNKTCSENNSGLHETIFKYSDGKLRCTPIQDWNINDLAAYIYEYDIPLLNVYKKMGLTMRTTARITKKARDFGSHEVFRFTNSRGYHKLIQYHQEIKQ